MLRKLLILLGLVGLGAVAGLYLLQGSPTTHKPASGLLIEASAVEIMDHIRSLKSPLVLVNFWASWCEPCRQEFPDILSLRQEFAGKGLNVVFISIDGNSDMSNAEEFLRENHVDFKSFFRGSQNVEQLVTGIFPKWEGAVPASILLGPKAEIVDAWEGDTSLEDFKKHILPHLRGT